MSDTTWYMGGIALVGAWFHGRSEWGWIDEATGARARASSSCTTYDTDALRAIRGHLTDGGVFVDKRPIPEDVLVEWVFVGPMESGDLPEGHARGWGEPYKMEIREDGIQGAARRVGSMGEIATDLYIALWASLGARIGVRKGDTVVWDDGSVDNL